MQLAKATAMKQYRPTTTNGNSRLGVGERERERGLFTETEEYNDNNVSRSSSGIVVSMSNTWAHNINNINTQYYY